MCCNKMSKPRKYLNIQLRKEGIKYLEVEDGFLKIMTKEFQSLVLGNRPREWKVPTGAISDSASYVILIRNCSRKQKAFCVIQVRRV